MYSYSHHKTTGLLWHKDEIPDTWSEVPFFTVFSENRFRNTLGLEQNLLSLSFGKIVRKDINSADGLLPENFNGYQIVEPRDLVFRLTDLQNDKRSLRSAIVHERGIITSAYLGVRPLRGYPSYWNYLFRTYDVMKTFYSMGGGLRQSMKYEDMKRLPVINPPLEEQRQIATYLNRETAKIDKLIAKQQKLIKLLQEKRQAVISQAVTRGVNPNVKMKDSGVDWLGDVPEHWTAGSLRWYVKIRSGDFIANTEFDSNQLRPCEVIGGNGVSGYTEIFNVSKAIVVGRVGALCGNVHILSKPSWVTDNALILEFSNKLHDDYAAEYLRCLDLNKLANKNAQPLITGSMIKSQRCLIPPLSEQRLISKKVDQTYHQFEYLAERAEDSIRLLKEYRQALITAAVTGKIDVRGLVTDEEVAALDADPVLEATEEDFESEVAEADYITEEE